MVRRWFCGVVLCSAVLSESHSAAAEPWDRPGWTLVFHDEFDGSALDTSKWLRRYKWGEKVVNGELQAYVDDAFRVRDGVLTIVGTNRPGAYARQQLAYRSGVLCSVHEQRYGYFEARLKMPKGQGFWPAFWLLGRPDGTGIHEIDVQEFLGHDVHTIYSTVHWGKSYGGGHHSDSRTLKGPDYTADFHTFGLEWDDDAVVWSIDGVEQMRHTGDGVPHVDMYVILNLAVGGNWPKAPDKTTHFPGEYAIDYVRAYTKAASVDAGAPSSDRDAGLLPSGRDAGARETAPPAIAQPSAPPIDSTPAPAPAPVAVAPRSGGCACRCADFGPARPGSLCAIALGALAAVRRRRPRGPDRRR